MGDSCSEAMEKTALKYAKDGDGSLLIWTPNLDFVADSQPVESLVIPYQSRVGGALYAVPLPFLDEQFLTEANSGEEETFLGPSKEFYSELIEEADESGAVVSVGTKAPILLIDLDDSVLQQMREYDPVTDSTSFPCPFSNEKPNAIVTLKDISEAVKEWIGLANGRQNFYSAREEPAPSKAAPKRQQKKVSTAVLADQVSALVAQMQLLTAQQEELKENFVQRGGATPVGEVANGLGESRLPFVAPTAKAHLPKQTLASLPPRTRAVVPVSGVGEVLPEDEPRDPSTRSQDQMGHQVAQALTQQSTAITALVAHLASGDPLADLASGGGGSSGLSAKGVARREKMQTDLATGVISILSGSASADLPKDVSCSPRPEDRGRGCELGSNHVWVPGEAWNLQGAEGSCPYPMDTCPCVRQCSKRRFSDLQRIPGSNGSKLGSSGIGWKLEHRISHIVAGRTAIPDDVREAESPFVSWSPICGHGAGSMECSGFGVSSRDGVVAEQKKRVEDCKAGNAFTKKEAKVSEKAKAPGRGGRKVDRSVKQSGKSFLPHVHHDNPAVNSSDQHPSFVPHTADRPSNGCRSEALGDNLHNGLGLGDIIVGPDNRPAGDSSEVGGSYLSTSWSYLKWCASLVPMVLRSRTPFASFLSQSIKLSKIPSGRSGLASTFFPVPIPLFGVFGWMPESSSPRLGMRVRSHEPPMSL